MDPSSVIETVEPDWRKDKGSAAGVALSQVDVAPLVQPDASKLCHVPTFPHPTHPRAEAEKLRRELLRAAVDGDDVGTATALRDLSVHHEIHADDDFLVGESRNTPMHLAVESGHSKVLAVLIDAGANVDATNYLGQTPAHVAATHAHVECIRMLGSPQALANFTVRDCTGRTPVELALARHHYSCASVIEQLTLDDQEIHMQRRFYEELHRQQAMLRKKEILFGRSLMSMEGAQEFTVPARAHLDDQSCFGVGTHLRAFAITPYFIAHGARQALEHLARAPGESEHETEARGERQPEQEEEKMDGAAAEDTEKPAPTRTRHTREFVPGRFPSQRWMPPGYVEQEPTEHLPGRISSQRWIDLSLGRPPDLGYDSCV